MTPPNSGERDATDGATPGAVAQSQLQRIEEGGLPYLDDIALHKALVTVRAMFSGCAESAVTGKQMKDGRADAEHLRSILLGVDYFRAHPEEFEKLGAKGPRPHEGAAPWHDMDLRVLLAIERLHTAGGLLCENQDGPTLNLVIRPHKQDLEVRLDLNPFFDAHDFEMLNRYEQAALLDPRKNRGLKEAIINAKTESATNKRTHARPAALLSWLIQGTTKKGHFPSLRSRGKDKSLFIPERFFQVLSLSVFLGTQESLDATKQALGPDIMAMFRDHFMGCYTSRNTPTREAGFDAMVSYLLSDFFPANREADATQPETSHPVTTQPETAQSETAQSDAAQPVISQSEAAQPKSAGSMIIQSETAQPTISQVETSQSQGSQSTISQSETSQSQSSQSETSPWQTSSSKMKQAARKRMAGDSDAKPATGPPATGPLATDQLGTGQPGFGEPAISQSETAQAEGSQPATSQLPTGQSETKWTGGEPTARGRLTASQFVKTICKELYDRGCIDSCQLETDTVEALTAHVQSTFFDRANNESETARPRTSNTVGQSTEAMKTRSLQELEKKLLGDTLYRPHSQPSKRPPGRLTIDDLFDIMERSNLPHLYGRLLKDLLVLLFECSDMERELIIDKWAAITAKRPKLDEQASRDELANPDEHGSPSSHARPRSTDVEVSIDYPHRVPFLCPHDQRLAMDPQFIGTSAGGSAATGRATAQLEARPRATSTPLDDRVSATEPPAPPRPALPSSRPSAAAGPPAGSLAGRLAAPNPQTRKFAVAGPQGRGRAIQRAAQRAAQRAGRPRSTNGTIANERPKTPSYRKPTISSKAKARGNAAETRPDAVAGSNRPVTRGSRNQANGP